MKNNSIQNQLQINQKSNIYYPIAKIVRIEAYGNYCKIIAEDQSFCIAKTLKLFADILPTNFIRLHSKHLINVDHISSISNNTVMMKNNDTVKMSRRKKHSALDKLRVEH